MDLPYETPKERQMLRMQKTFKNLCKWGSYATYGASYLNPKKSFVFLGMVLNAAGGDIVQPLINGKVQYKIHTRRTQDLQDSLPMLRQELADLLPDIDTSLEGLQTIGENVLSGYEETHLKAGVFDHLTTNERNMLEVYVDRDLRSHLHSVRQLRDDNTHMVDVLSQVLKAQSE